jgi:hypothetical protein
MDESVTKKPFEAGARRKFETMSCEDLDELVHDLKGEEAATINNSGKDSQIEYLLGNEVNKPAKKYYRTVYKFEVLSDEMDKPVIEITNYRHLKESITLILLKYLDSKILTKILEEWDDAIANNIDYLKEDIVETR